jgi:type III secretory pathway component EscV
MATLTIQTSYDPEVAALLLQQEVDKVQADLFESLGVVSPLPAYERNETLDASTFTALLDGQQLCSGSMVLAQPALLHQLKQRAAMLVTSLVVAFHLRQLAVTLPDLVAAADKAFPLEELTRLLRARVASGASIRNLRLTLEDLLQTAPPAAVSPGNIS